MQILDMFEESWSYDYTWGYSQLAKLAALKWMDDEWYDTRSRHRAVEYALHCGTECIYKVRQNELRVIPLKELLKGKGSPYSITERRVPELIPVLCSQLAGGVSHKPGGRLPLLSARPAVTFATIKRAATSFAAWWTKAQWVWTVCLRL